MHNNPAADWQALAERYRSMFDGELIRLAAQFDDLTETAQQVLRGELSSRGLAQPGAVPAGARRGVPPTAVRFSSAVDPDAAFDRPSDADGSDEDDSPKEFTWQTRLCECETAEQALGICEMLRRAGIDSWYEPQGSRMGIWGPRVTVAADQLEEATQIASRPIPQDILDDLRVVVPEYELPRCPACRAEDPVLEGVEPSNSWLCESCARQWADPVADGELESGKSVP